MLSPGSAANVRIFVQPAETIPIFYAVVLVDTRLYLADPTDLSQMGHQVGVSVQMGRQTSIEVQLLGEVLGGTWIAGANYYVGAGGVLSTSPTFPGMAWSQYVGFARDAHTFEVMTGPPIIRDLATPDVFLTVNADGFLAEAVVPMPLPDLTGSTGVVVQTGTNTYVARTLTAGTGITVTNGSGVAANPLISLLTPVSIANGGTALSTIPTSGQLLIGTGAAYALSTLTAGSGISITNGAGSITVAATAPATPDLTGSTGVVVQTSASTYVARSVAVASAKLTVANGSGVAGNPTLDLGSITGGTGIVAQTGAGTYSPRTITAGTGITVANGDGVAANPTVALISPVTIATGGTSLTTAPANGQLLIGSGGIYALNTLTAGTGITIVNAAGTITINATATPVARFTSANQVITAGGGLTLAHGLGSTPAHIWMALVNTTAELGYAVGQKATLQIYGKNATSPALTCVPDATNLNIRYSNTSPVFAIARFDTGAQANATNANWRVIFYAEL